MRLIIILSIFMTNILLSDTIKCTNKQFLLNLLNSETTWIPIGTNAEEKYAPFSALKTNQGAFLVLTPGSDFIMRHIGIKYSSDGIRNIILQSTKHYRSEISKKYEKYYDKTFILKPYQDDCSLKNIILEVYIDTNNLFNIQKESILFKKKDLNESIDSRIVPKILKVFKL